MRRLRLSYIELPSLADRRGSGLPDLASARHVHFALSARLLRTTDEDSLWEWSRLLSTEVPWCMHEHKAEPMRCECCRKPEDLPVFTSRTAAAFSCQRYVNYNHPRT